MTYTPPNHIAIVRVGKLAGNREVAFWVEAVRKQLQEHVAPAWGLPPPGVFMYDENTFIPTNEGALIAIVDNDFNDDAAGFHSIVGDMPFGMVDLGQSSVPSRTLSHEALELWANAMLDRWVPGPNNLEYAVELCDACQRSQYTIDVELFGERESVVVSDFITPSWLELEGSVGRHDYMGVIGGSFSLAPGGYAIARNDGGEVVYLSHRDGAFMEPRKLSKYGRTSRLIHKPSKAERPAEPVAIELDRGKLVVR